MPGRENERFVVCEGYGDMHLQHAEGDMRLQHAEKADFSMSPELDKPQPPDEISEPYRLLAPLVALSFPSGIAPHPNEGSPSWHRLAAEKRSIERQGTAKDRDGRAGRRLITQRKTKKSIRVPAK